LVFVTVLGATVIIPPQGGGGSTPGGNSGDVQYNNAGALGGVSGITLTAGALTSIDIGDSGQTISKNAAGEINIEGVQALTASDTVTVTGKTLRGPNGSRAAPTYSFSSDNTRGLTSSPDVGNAVEIVAGGAQMLTIAISGLFSYTDWIEAQTGTYTATLVDSHKSFTNTGDTDGSTITLRNNPEAGVLYKFAVTTAQTQTIQPSAGETLYFGSSTCATLACATVGCTIEIEAKTSGSGALWMTNKHEGTWVCS
jgi:hypothetical protein